MFFSVLRRKAYMHSTVHLLGKTFFSIEENPIGLSFNFLRIFKSLYDNAKESVRTCNGPKVPHITPHRINFITLRNYGCYFNFQTIYAYL